MRYIFHWMRFISVLNDEILLPIQFFHDQRLNFFRIRALWSKAVRGVRWPWSSRWHGNLFASGYTPLRLDGQVSQRCWRLSAPQASQNSISVVYMDFAGTHQSVLPNHPMRGQQLLLMDFSPNSADRQDAQACGGTSRRSHRGIKLLKTQLWCPELRSTQYLDRG